MNAGLWDFLKREYRRLKSQLGGINEMREQILYINAVQAIAPHAPRQIRPIQNSLEPLHVLFTHHSKRPRLTQV